MSSYAERLAVDIRNAYEGRDREAMESALTRMVAAIAYTGPLPQAHTQPAGDACSRKLLGCECTTPEQQSHCMFRAT